jgi:hypothetical protein
VHERLPVGESSNVTCCDNALNAACHCYAWQRPPLTLSRHTRVAWLGSGRACTTHFRCTHVRPCLCHTLIQCFRPATTTRYSPTATQTPAPASQGHADTSANTHTSLLLPLRQPDCPACPHPRCTSSSSHQPHASSILGVHGLVVRLRGRGACVDMRTPASVSAHTQPAAATAPAS